MNQSTSPDHAETLPADRNGLPADAKVTFETEQARSFPECLTQSQQYDVLVRGWQQIGSELKEAIAFEHKIAAALITLIALSANFLAQRLGSSENMNVRWGIAGWCVI